MFDADLAAAAPAADTTRDLIASELANKAAYAAPRRHQGAPTAHTAALDEVRAIAEALRQGVLASDPTSMRAVIATLAGVGLNSVGRITVGTAPRPGSSTIHIDVTTGTMWTDYGRIALEHAAQPGRPEQVLPASHWVPKPIPTWLSDELAAAPTATATGEMVDLDTLIPSPPMPRSVALARGQHVGRMRPTLVRLQAGMSQLLLSLGHSELTTALALNDMTLVPRARIFYVALPAQEIADACQDLYQHLGWGERGCAPVSMYVGSKVVAAETTIQACWTHLREWTEKALPARRCRLEQVIEHHNRYVATAAWLFTFLIGARNSQVLPVSAVSCQPGLMYLIYPDKRTGPFGTPRPAIVCSTASRQIGLYVAHLRALASRARIAAPSNPWLRHVQAALARRDVAFFFRIENDDIRPLGTADVMSALPPGMDLAPNFGRHFWQTALHVRGLSSHVIDVYARHTARGTESMTTTTMLPLVTAHALIDEAQECTLAGMGITPLAGQGRRSRL
jgi:hypothetical protein